MPALLSIILLCFTPEFPFPENIAAFQAAQPFMQKKTRPKARPHFQINFPTKA